MVTPIHREAEYLDRVAQAMARQQRPPDCWIVVDDGSRDGGREIAEKWTHELPYMSVISTLQFGTTAPRPKDGLAHARDARAFNLGLEVGSWRAFTHVGKLDGDVELPPHWFASLIERFRHEPRLGIGGGRLVEPNTRGQWQEIPIPPYHVHGAVKLYSRDCLEAIGGVSERLAWDTIDETYARMAGFSTLSPRALVARHHRPHATADGRLRGRARHGECAWILHQPASWALLRSIKAATNAPFGLSGAAFAYGYLRAACTSTPRVDDPLFRRYVRRELQFRVRAHVRKLQSVSRVGSLSHWN